MGRKRKEDSEVSDVFETEDTTEETEKDVDLTSDEVEKLKEYNRLLDEKIKELTERSEKEKKLEELEKQEKVLIETRKKKLGIITRGKYEFTKAERESLSKYNSDEAKGIYYQFTMTDDCPRETFAIAGQSFNRHAYVLEGGNCPRCAKEKKLAKVKKTPVIAGQSNPKCPKCGTILQYDKDDENSLSKMKQNYTGVTGDALWMIAMLANEKVFSTKGYDDVTGLPTLPVDKKIVEYAKVYMIQFNKDMSNIESSVEIDLKRIYDHYQATCERDSKGKVVKEGEKSIFKVEYTPDAPESPREEKISDIF